MVRRVTPAQFAALQRQAVQRYNREVDRVNRHNKQVVDNINRANKRIVDDYNRWARSYNQNLRTAVSRHNQSVRTHNAQVQARRQRLLSALRSSTSTTTYTTLRSSTMTLNASFEGVAGQSDQFGSDFIDLAEREATNGLATIRALEADEADDVEPVEETEGEDAAVVACLDGLSADLKLRWEGAVFSLNPRNPDAARHFCTSVREVITEILDITAPDGDVVSADPACERQQHNDRPTRRAKISHLLRVKGISSDDATNFVDADVSNILELFSVFNSATHGPAGKHDFNRLRAIKERVKGGIMFLTSLAAPA